MFYYYIASVTFFIAIAVGTVYTHEVSPSQKVTFTLYTYYTKRYIHQTIKQGNWRVEKRGKNKFYMHQKSLDKTKKRHENELKAYRSAECMICGTLLKLPLGNVDSIWSKHIKNEDHKRSLKRLFLLTS